MTIPPHIKISSKEEGIFVKVIFKQSKNYVRTSSQTDHLIRLNLIVFVVVCLCFQIFVDIGPKLETKDLDKLPFCFDRFIQCKEGFVISYRLAQGGCFNLLCTGVCDHTTGKLPNTIQQDIHRNIRLAGNSPAGYSARTILLPITQKIRHYGKNESYLTQ